MKRVLNIVLIVITIFLVGCSLNVSNFRHLSIENGKEFIQDININNYYIPVGKEVVVKTYCFTDVDLAMYIDGEFYSFQTIKKNGNEFEWIYSFIMPDSNIVISFKMDNDNKVYLQTTYFNSESIIFNESFDFDEFCHKYNLEHNSFLIKNIDIYDDIYLELTGENLNSKLKEKIANKMINYDYLLFARNVSELNYKDINYIYDIYQKQIIIEYPNKIHVSEEISFISVEIVQISKNYYIS